MSHLQIIRADARRLPLADSSVQCVVTSPPYWGLRKYSGEQELVWPDSSRDFFPVPSAAVIPDKIYAKNPAEQCIHQWGGQIPLRGKTNLDTFFDEKTGQPKKSAESIAASQPEGHGQYCQRCGAWRGSYGLEPTIEMYVAHSLVILRELWRVLRADGVVFWNIGDSYASGKGTCYNPGGGRNSLTGHMALKENQAYPLNRGNKTDLDAQGIKPKDLCLIPERIALAAQAAGWWVRSRILWCKPNPMPESVTDRPTDAAEHIWMFTKSARYFWDADAVRETSVEPDRERNDQFGGNKGIEVNHSPGGMSNGHQSRNLRNVWTFSTHPYADAHFATFPEELPRRCILAATSERGACIQCGAPWVRVTAGGVDESSWKGSTFDGERDLEVRPNTQRRTDKQSQLGKRTYTGFNDRWDAREKARTNTAYEKGSNPGRIALLRQQARENGGEYVNESHIIGWQPGCRCRGQRGRTRPCVVLDHFGGSGTVGRVAVELNRDCVLVDLHYQELQARRTTNVQRNLVMAFS